MNRYPLRVGARRDESLSRWLWLVKWLLLIPHYVVLLFLYAGLVVLTLVAYLAVLFTGRYPHAIAAYNLGVLRWSWRVNYYGYQVLGTDRYPPFTLADVPDYPARLELDEMPHPPRWLPLVAWLFAVPHILIVGALTGAATWDFDPGSDTVAVPLGVVTIGLLVAGVSLLFTGAVPTRALRSADGRRPMEPAGGRLSDAARPAVSAVPSRPGCGRAGRRTGRAGEFCRAHASILQWRRCRTGDRTDRGCAPAGARRRPDRRRRRAARPRQCPGQRRLRHQPGVECPELDRGDHRRRHHPASG